MIFQVWQTESPRMGRHSELCFFVSVQTSSSVVFLESPERVSPGLIAFQFASDVIIQREQRQCRDRGDSRLQGNLRM